MEVNNFVILVVSFVVIAVTAIIVITLEPSKEYPKANIWDFLGRFQSDENGSKTTKEMTRITIHGGIILKSFHKLPQKI